MGNQKIKKDSWDKVIEVYGMILEEHTGKQVQMHVATQTIANRLVKKCMQFTAHTKICVQKMHIFRC